MKPHLLTSLQATVILLILGTYVHAQPTQITQVSRASTNFIAIGDLVFFTSNDSLFRTDGTANGTIFLKNGITFPWRTVEFKGMLFFTQKTPGPFEYRWMELWRSDGTTSGTILLKTSADFNIRMETQSANHLFFQASDFNSGLELFKTDGTIGGTQMIRDILPGPGDGYAGHATVVGDWIFFAGRDAEHGTELWKTNGTASNTMMVKDIFPGYKDGFVTQAAPGVPYPPGVTFSDDSHFYFRGRTPLYGEEPWVSDGTAAGTVLLKDVVAGSGSPQDVLYKISHDDVVYFMVYHEETELGEFTDLWKTGGTPATTSLVKVLGDDNYQFLVYNDKVYFFLWPYGIESFLWVTDGTEAGTQQIFELTTHEGGIWFFEVVNEHLLFFGNHQGYHSCFYRSDGTTAGTRMFTCFNSAGYLAGPRDVTKIGDLVFYADHDGRGYEGVPDDPSDYYHLFQSDGFTTQSMNTLFGVSTIGTDNIVNFKGKVMFTTQQQTRFDPNAPKHLWVYDPSATPLPNAGTIQAEVWSGVEGRDVASIPVDEPASSLTDLTLFETPSNIGDNYGSRVRGYVIPPISGGYTFWVASDDRGELWLSSDEDPANKSKIAEVTGWTDPRQWYKYPSQQSAPVQLEAGKKYYIEALLKEMTGRDHLAVGWRLPWGGDELPIPGSRLVPFESTDTPEPCAGSGIIRQEFWTNVPGTRVSDVPTDTQPDFTQDLTLFEGPSSPVGDNYGSRIRGYICPPSSGEYIFWISGDDQVELWLSTSDDPANKRRIAYHTGWTQRRQWDRYTTQQSVAITLQAGQRYYVEALMKEGGGADHVSVGWQLPNGTLQRPIAGAHLIPFGSSEPPTACAGTGTISVETWTGIDGVRVSSIPVNTAPNLTGTRTLFEAPTNVGSNFGSRFRGYVCVPASGNYTFWIASDDHSELWLSTDNDPANKRLIANVWGWTTSRQWDKYSTQQSAPIPLVAGQQYYIEALYKEDEGGDNMAVGWQLPDGTMERPIPGNRLSPFEEATSAMAARTSSEQELYQQISIYPNPVRSGDAQLTISGFEGIDRLIETNVQIMNMTGEVVFSESVLCGGNCGSYLMKINEQLVPGVYVVNMETNGVRTAKRLLVK